MQKVFIFGAGRSGIHTMHAFQKYFHVLGFIDNDAQKWMHPLCNLPIQSPDSLKTLEYDLVLIASVHANAIYHQLVESLSLSTNKIRIVANSICSGQYPQTNIWEAPIEKTILSLSNTASTDCTPLDTSQDYRYFHDRALTDCFIHFDQPFATEPNFNNFMQRNLGPCYQPMDFDQSWISALDMRKEITAVRTRASFDEALLNTSDRNVYGIAFIRDPIEQFCLEYAYMQKRPIVVNPVKEQTIEEYFETRKNFNYLEKLLGSIDDHALEHIQQLVENKKLFLFPSECLDESCQALRQQFPDYFHFLDDAPLSEFVKPACLTPALETRIREQQPAFTEALRALANSCMQTHLQTHANG